MYFNLKKIDKETSKTYEKSKILGSPVFPNGFFSNHHLDSLFFVAQINLNQIQIDELPKKGFLYFFLDVSNTTFQPKVIYTEDEVEEVYDMLNEDFTDFGSPEGYFLVPTNKNEDTGIEVGTPYAFNEPIENDTDYDSYISLLALDSLALPIDVLSLGTMDGWYVFAIKKEDLRKKDFSKVKYLTFGS